MLILFQSPKRSLVKERLDLVAGLPIIHCPYDCERIYALTAQADGLWKGKVMVLNPIRALIKKFKRRESQSPPVSDASLRLAKVIGPEIDRMANEIFLLYTRRLDLNPPTHIIAAVWGNKANETLDELQQYIVQKVTFKVQKILALLTSDQTDPSQMFAMEFIVKGLLITKVLYMLEVLKSKIEKDVNVGGAQREPLESIDPIGHA